MRFSVTMPDDLIEQIDEAAGRIGIPRTEWIRNACTDHLTPAAPGPTPEEHQALREAVQAAGDRADLREQRIADLEHRIKELEADRDYHRGEIARLAQANSLLTHRLLPPPKPGALTRIRRWWSGGDE